QPRGLMSGLYTLSGLATDPRRPLRGGQPDESTSLRVHILKSFLKSTSLSLPECPIPVTRAARDNHPVACPRSLKQSRKCVSESPANWWSVTQRWQVFAL